MIRKEERAVPRQSCAGKFSQVQDGANDECYVRVLLSRSN